MNWKPWAIVGGACYLPALFLLTWWFNNPVFIFAGALLPAMAAVGAIVVACIIEETNYNKYDG